MKSISDQINPKIILQAKKLAQYTQLLNRFLPIECRAHVTVANIRDQNLMLITDSPVWTTRLRQLAPEILRFVSENSSTMDKPQIIHHLQISTRYSTVITENEQSAAHKRWQRPEISEKTARLLTQSANSISDQRLKTALLKIAAHHPGQKKTDR